jgi:hypothetical protein
MGGGWNEVQLIALHIVAINAMRTFGHVNIAQAVCGNATRQTGALRRVFTGDGNAPEDGRINKCRQAAEKFNGVNLSGRIGCGHSHNNGIHHETGCNGQRKYLGADPFCRPAAFIN